MYKQLFYYATTVLIDCTERGNCIILAQPTQNILYSWVKHQIVITPVKTNVINSFNRPEYFIHFENNVFLSGTKQIELLLLPIIEVIYEKIKIIILFHTSFTYT